MKKYLHIVIAVALAMSAGIFVWLFVNMNTPSVNVVITTVRLPVGAVINENHLTTKLVAKSILPADALTNPSDAIGRMLSHAVLADEILRREHVAAGGGSLVARLITAAPGKVAVDLPPEAAQGLTGLVMGDLVNVYGETAVDFGGGQVGSFVQKVADRAVVVAAPPTGARERTAIVLACAPEEELQIAQVLSNNKKVTLFLLPDEIATEENPAPENVIDENEGSGGYVSAE